MKKRVFVILLCLVMVMAIAAGCAAKTTETGTTDETTTVVESEETSDAAATDAGEKIYIPVISKGWQHQFWQAVKKGAEQAAADYNVEMTFEGPEGDFAVDQQIEMITTALAKKPKALVLAACDSKAVIPQVEQAAEMGIPVIGFDSGVDSDLLLTTCATDNTLAAGYAADMMAEAIGLEGEVAIVVHDQVSATGITRRDGFVNRIEEKYPNITVVDIQYGGGDHLKSTDLTKAIIAAHPNIKGIFGANEGSAIGVINAVSELKMEGQIVLVGYDAGQLQKDAVRSGLMLGAISQDPVAIGYKAVEAAVKAINGEEVSALIDTGFAWYDKDNMDNPEFADLLYD